MTDTPRILVIDDDAMQQRLLQMLLGLKGYEVISAMTGEEGKARLAEDRYDLILLDLVMPKLDGLSFLRWLRSEAGKTMPVVVVSSKEESILDAIEDIGDTTFQRKPVDLERLSEDIRQILDSPTS